MSNRIEVVPYDPAFALQTAQAYLEIFSVSPWNEAQSLNEAMSQLESDVQRPGFGGIVLKASGSSHIIGFSWWFDITSAELQDRWWSRFTPRQNIPEPAGRGVYLNEFGVLPTYQHHGLGCRMLKATLAQIEPEHDWITLNTHKFAHAGLALLKSEAFLELDLTGVQVATRICMMKHIPH